MEPNSESFNTTLSSIADDVSSESVERVRSAVVTRPKPRVRGQAIAAIAGVAAAASVVFALNLGGGPGGQATSTGPSTPGTDFISGDIKPGEPCPAARQLALDDLKAAGSPPVWMPSHAAASARNLAGVFSCSGTPTLKFPHATISYEPGWNVADPAARWQEMAEQWGAGRVEIVLGRPAFVLEVGEMGPLGEVLVIVDNTAIRVHGDGTLPLKALVALTNSIDVGRPL